MQGLLHADLANSAERLLYKGVAILHLQGIFRWLCFLADEKERFGTMTL